MNTENTSGSVAITEELIQKRCAQAQHLLKVSCLALSVAVTKKSYRTKFVRSRLNRRPPPKSPHS